MQTKAVSDLIQLINEILANYLKGRTEIKIYDSTFGFRVIIMTEANSLVNKRILELISKLKTRIINSCRTV